jgi:hypothetical protein
MSQGAQADGFSKSTLPRSKSPQTPVTLILFVSNHNVFILQLNYSTEERRNSVIFAE